METRLSGLPFVPATFKAALVKELPRYIQVARIATDITPYNLTDWCRQHADKIPAWSELQAIGAWLQPTSGGAERVFALASTQVDEHQASGLEDMISLSVMLQYNERLKTNRRSPRESPPSGSFAQALRLQLFPIEKPMAARAPCHARRWRTADHLPGAYPVT